MARDLRMNTELRKIILEEDDEDEDEFIPTIYDIYHESNIIRGTDPDWVQQHMGYVFLPEASPGMPAITSSKVPDLQVWWRGVWGDYDDPHWGHCGYRRNSLSAGS